MIRFLLKGLFRDRNRSFLPVLVVAAGVSLTVLGQCWITGILSDMIRFNADFATGHVNVMSRAYAELQNQSPNDLALSGISKLKSTLEQEFPDMIWAERIKFGGLLDIPDEDGETRAQGPVTGIAADLLSENSREPERLQITKALERGSLPDKPGEILISEEFARKLDVNPGEKATLMSSTMYGSLSFRNYTISGTVRFGVALLDRGAILVDISDARDALDMQDASGELLGYFPDNEYNDELAAMVAQQFNSKYSDSTDRFSPVMVRLSDQSELSTYIDFVGAAVGIVIFVFVLAMSIVLWNTGLIGGLRRYGEVGVRLAIGEVKGHIYRSMIFESVMIGIIGSAVGTAIGLSFAYWLQEKGMDFSQIMQNATMMMQTTLRTQITTSSYYIGFIPGLFSTVLGTMLSGIGIYRRQTARLFKEMEA